MVTKAQLFFCVIQGLELLILELFIPNQTEQQNNHRKFRSVLYGPMGNSFTVKIYC